MNSIMATIALVFIPIISNGDMSNLWEEDPHLIFYRMLCVEQKIVELEGSLNSIEGNQELVKECHEHLVMIKYCLGLK